MAKSFINKIISFKSLFSYLFLVQFTLNPLYGMDMDVLEKRDRGLALKLARLDTNHPAGDFDLDDEDVIREQELETSRVRTRNKSKKGGYVEDFPWSNASGSGVHHEANKEKELANRNRRRTFSQANEKADDKGGPVRKRQRNERHIQAPTVEESETDSENGSVAGSATSEETSEDEDSEGSSMKGSAGESDSEDLEDEEDDDSEGGSGTSSDEEAPFTEGFLGGALRLYKAKGILEFKKYFKGRAKKKKLIDVNPETFTLYVFKKTRRLAVHEKELAKFVGYKVKGESLEEFKSLYFIRTAKSVYIAACGAATNLIKKGLDYRFGFKVKRRLKLEKLKKDRVVNLQSALQTEETYSYRRPAPVSLQHSTSHVYLQKNQTFIVKKGPLKTLEKDGRDVLASFNPNGIVAYKSVKINDLPSICNELDAVLEQEEEKEGKGSAVIVESNADKEKLDQHLIEIITKKEDKVRLKWSLLTPKKPGIYAVYKEFAIFSTIRHKIIPDQRYESIEEALEMMAEKIEELSPDDDGIKSLKSFTIRGVRRVTSRTPQLSNPYKIFKDSIEARFRYKLDKPSARRIEYFLSDGIWYSLPASFSIKEEFESLPSVKMVTTPGSTMSFKRRKNARKWEDESEGSFNFRQSLENPNIILSTDKLMIPHQFEGWGIEGQSFEPFDLINLKDKYLITVKDGTGGEGISHLMWQANIAALRLLNPLYREWLRHYLLVCETLKAKDFYDVRTQEDFFNKREVPLNSPYVYREDEEGITLKTLAYDILKKTYDDDKTLKTKDFIKRLKVLLLKDIDLFKNETRLLDNNIDAINKRISPFFSGYKPEDITVVVAFMRSKPKQVISSPSIMESVYDGLKRIERMGYKIAISYIDAEA